MTEESKILKSFKDMKIGHKIYFYGLESCITCAIIFPLINMSSKHNLVDDVETIIYPNKDEYKKNIIPILKQYKSRELEESSEIPVPVILIQQKPGEPKKLVSPAIITEVAMTLSDELNDFQKMEYMDGELINIFMINLLHKMTSNLID